MDTLLANDIEKIVQRIRAGDADVYARIVQEFERDVRSIIATGLHDFQATDELVQQTFVNAYFALPTFHMGEDFRGWLRAIARNLLRDEIRRRGNEYRHTLVYKQYVVRRLEENSEGDGLQDKYLDSIQRCLEKLPPDARHALELRYPQGMDFSKIAAEINRTVAGTRQLLARVRIRLRDCIGRSEGSLA